MERIYLSIEEGVIAYVPPESRHGKVWRLTKEEQCRHSSTTRIGALELLGGRGVFPRDPQWFLGYDTPSIFKSVKG